MWNYEKKLQFPINIKQQNAALAKYILNQYGGPNGELGASLTYLSQRYAMPCNEAKAILTDVGTEEIGHMEMVATIVSQLIKNMTPAQLERAGMGDYYANHGKGIFPSTGGGVPFTAAYISSQGDPISDLTNDMAAEQKARITYEYLMNLTDDPDVLNPLRFLRQREVVHFQRFGEALDIVQRKLAQPKFYMGNKENANMANMPNNMMNNNMAENNMANMANLANMANNNMSIMPDKKSKMMP